jgi:hypothetical protein
MLLYIYIFLSEKRKSPVVSSTGLFNVISSLVYIHETATLRPYGVVSSATNLYLLKLFSLYFVLIRLQM